MLFNKNKARKVNDKKVLKKVKKQWVTVSVATLAFLGAAGVSTISSNSVVAHADVKSTVESTETDGNHGSTETDGNHGSTETDGNHGSTETDGNHGSTETDGNHGSTETDGNHGSTETDGNHGSTETDGNHGSTGTDGNHGSTETDGNHGSTETDGNHGSTGTDGNHGSDQTSNTPLSKDAQNGFNDALNNKTNSDTNTNDDYSKAFNEGQQKKSIIDQAASDAYNSKANNASVYNDNDDKSYYNNAYNGVINAQSQYNNAVQDKGTSDQYDGYDTSKDTNAQTAQQNQQKYESDYLSKYNSNSNYSVRSGEVKIPTVDTIYNNGGDVNQANAYADLAYKYGIQYFLSHQGAADAESGKWNGIVQGQDLNGKTGNVYTPSADSSNPYDLAYRGVQDAINQQFDNNNNLKFNSNNYSQLTTSNADDFYKSGFNDVVNQIKQGSVFVSNASQYKNTFFGNNNALSTSTIANVKIVNDINFDKDDNYSAPQNSVTSKNNVSIDAQNHIVDFKSYNVNFTFSDANNGMLTVKNFRTYYSENYYGSITLTNANATFENINYVGPQMLNSSSSNAYMSGVVNSFNVTNVSNPFTMNNSSNNPITKNKIDHSYRVYNDSAQCNLEIKNLSLNPGAKFFGRSDEYIGGTVANVTGNLSLGKNSEMVLVPRGNGGEDNWNGQSVGINLSGSLNLNNNSKLDIISSTSSDSSRITNYNYSPSIYTSGSVNILGGSLRTFTNGSIYSSGSYSDTSIYSSGTINIKDSGSLFVYSDNLGNSSTKSNYGLIYNGANLNVSNKGNLYVSAGSNSTGAITLLGGNAINVNDPGETHVVFDLTGNNNPQSKLFYATNLTGYAVKVRNAKDGQFGGPYYKYTVNSDGSISSVGANLNQSSSKNGTIGNYLEFNGVPSVYYNSPLTISAKPDSNGNYQLNGSVKVYDHQSDLNIYIQVKSGNSTSYDSLNSDINNDKSNSDKNISDVTGYLYNTVISLPADYKDGDNVNFSIDVPKNKISQGTSLGTLIRYGVTGIDSTLGNISVDSSGNTNMNSSSYNVNSNNYDLDSNGKLTKKGSTVIVNNGSLSNIGTGVSDGIMDASNNNSNNKKAGQYPSNVDYTNAYDSALAGYNDYYSGNNNNSPANEYAYQQGRDAAQKDSVAFTNGANAYVTNQQKADNTNQTKKYQDNYSKGYDDAQAGYAAVTDATPNPSTDGQSSAYAIGVNVGKAAKAGIDDDIKGNGDNSANYTDRNQKLAYQNAQLAYQAGLAGKDAKDSNASKNDKAYQAGSAANNGIKDAQSKPEGKASDYGYNDGTPAANAYNQAKANFDAGVNGKDKLANGSSADTKGTAYQAGAAANNGIKDAQSKPEGKASDYGYNDGTPAANAYNQAKANFDAGVNGKDKLANGSAADTKGTAYQAGAAANNGIKDAQSKPEGKASDYGYNDGTPAANAYNQAKANFDAGVNGKDKLANGSAADTKGTAYQAGAAANNGIKDAQNKPEGKASDYGYNDGTPAANAYNQAKANFDAGVNGKDKLANRSAADTKGTAYQAGAAANNGIKDAQSKPEGKASDYGYNDGTPAANAYNQAKANFDAGVNGKDKLANGSAADTKGTAYQAGAAANNGIKDAQSKPEDKASDYGYNDGTPAANAYNQAKANFDAGVNGKDKLANGSAADTKGTAYQAGAAANNGIKDAQSKPEGKASDYGYNDGTPAANAYNQAKANFDAGVNGKDKLANGSAADTKGTAYQAGAAANNGIKDAQSKPEGKASDYGYNDGTPVSDAYNQAKANFDAGVNGKDKLVNGSSADTKGAAYQVGKAAYDGINDDINGNGDKSANYTDANQKAAYQNAQKAYNAGLAGNTTTDDAKLNKTANVAGIGAKAGMEDAIKGETHEPTDANQKAAYDNAQKAYQAGFNGDIDSTVAKSNAMANKLGSSAKSGADAFMNGSTTNPGDANGDNNAKAIYNGYQAAQDGYNKALNNQPKPNNSPASVAGFNFGQSIVAGINDFAAGKSAANPSDVNYMKGYNSAQSGYKAGAQDATNNKPNATQNGSLNIPSSSDKASYISSYNGAYNGYKDGLNGKQANTASETVPYQQAYANGVKQGQSDAAAALAASMNNNVAQPVDETAKVTKDFMDGNLDKLAGEGYGDLYKQMQAGFETAMKHGTKNLNASDVYSSGYKMAQDGLAGMQAAKSGKTVDLKDASQAFVSGMNGYKAGLKAAIKGNSNSDIVYKSTYKNGYKDGMKKAIKIATNTAKKQAKSSKKMPNLKEYSKEYAKAYTKAFKEERLNETYYTKASKGSHFKVTSKHGIYAHSSDKFTNANKTRKLPNNETFSVKKVVKVNGVTRFYINSNEYVTSNKDLVKLSK